MRCWRACSSVRPAETADRGLGVARRDGAADVVITYGDALGIGRRGSKTDELPTPLVPGSSGSWRVGPGDAGWNDDGFIESRVFQAGYPESARAACVAKQLVLEPLRGRRR